MEDQSRLAKHVFHCQRETRPQKKELHTFVSHSLNNNALCCLSLTHLIKNAYVMVNVLIFWVRPFSSSA